jgi:PadR family transcriptional regulator, regulatory protein AphA
MDVKTLCLGVLTEGDKTGYEIKRCFEDSFSHFFGASFGSIYPALAELTRQGLVTCRSVEQDRRPDKKVYSVTPEGRRALVGELLATPPRHKVRSEFLVLIYFAHLLPPEHVARIIDERLAQWQPVVAEIEQICASGVCPDGQPVTQGVRFAAGYGRAVLGAALDYVRSHRHELLREIAEDVERPAQALAGAAD